jgi:hypothetical protein
MVDRVGTTNAACKPWRRLDIWRSLTLSSSGLGHRPFTAVTRVRIPLGSRLYTRENGLYRVFPFLLINTRLNACFHRKIATNSYEFKLAREREKSYNRGRS